MRKLTILAIGLIAGLALLHCERTALYCAEDADCQSARCLLPQHRCAGGTGGTDGGQGDGDVPVVPDKGVLLRIQGGAGTVERVGSPPFTCEGRCLLDVPRGTPITLVAREGSEAAFLGWSGACTGTGPRCELVYDHPATAVARFAICNGDLNRFCWDHPYPHGENISRLWGTADDLWAVGGQGIIQHFDGLDWRAVPSGTRADLRVLQGFTSTDVWAAGTEWTGADFRGVILHWNGTRWEVRYSNGARIVAAWGSGPKDIWFVGGEYGKEALALHWDGTTLAPSQTGLRGIASSVWGAGDGEVWMAGATAKDIGPAVAARWDGSRWSVSSPPTTESVSQVHGLSKTEIWALSRTNQGAASLWRLANQTWALDPSTALAGKVRRLLSTPAGELWAIGDLGTALRYSGGAWEAWPMASADTVSALTDGGSGVQYAAAGSKLFRRQGGGNFTAVASADGNLLALHGVAADLFAAGWGGTLGRLRGAAWQPVREGRPRSYYATYGTGSNLWLVGEEGAILRYDGKGWSEIDSGTRQALAAIFGVSDDVWIAGDGGVILHFRKGVKQEVTSPTTANLTAVWGSGVDDIWIVGDGVVLHWDGQRLAQPSLPEKFGLNAVWGTGPGDVWAVGGGRSALHWTGSRFELIDLKGLDTTYWAVFGGPGDVWVRGLFAIAHWNGSAIEDRTPPERMSLLRRHLRLGGQTWLIEDSGQSHVFSVTTWTRYPVPLFGVLFDISGWKWDDLWAVGSGAAHFNGTTWSKVPIRSSSETNLIADDPRAPVLVGNGAVIRRRPY